MADRAAITLHALGAETGAGEGEAIDLGERRTAALLTLRATVVGASKQVAIQTSPDGSTGWRQVGVMPTLTSPGTARRAFDRLERYLRASWPDGTDATFEVVGEAHQLYATADDIKGDAPASLLERAEAKEPGTRARALIRGSAKVEGALRPIYPLPLTTVPEEVVAAAASLAAFEMLKGNGLAGGGIDEVIVDAKNDAVKWLGRVAKREVTIAGITPEAAPAVQGSSGNPTYPDTYPERFSNNWGDF